MNEREIFIKACEISDLSARIAFLDQACGGNSVLRAHLSDLVAAQSDLNEFLMTPALEQLGILPVGSMNDVEPPRQDRPDIPRNHEQGGSKGNEEDDLDEVSLAFLHPSSKLDSLGRIGQYEILQILGRGAFGIVFKAFDDKLQRIVAIKVLTHELAATSPARKRFIREARAVAAVRHEHIVQIHNVEEQPIPFLVMEFIPGQTIQQRIDETGPLELAEVLFIGEQIARGLAAAHASGLIHRDIKPSNILIENTDNPHVKITDFGLARAADDASVTQSGIVAGTPMYMSPEQATGGHLDYRTDLFSLGSVLYAMVSGRPPFRAPSAVAVLRRVAEDTARPIQEIISNVPDWFCNVVAKLHAKRPEDRFGSTIEVADLLSRCLDEFHRGGVPTVPQFPSSGKREKKIALMHQRQFLIVLSAIIVIIISIALVAAYKRSEKVSDSQNEALVSSDSRVDTQDQSTKAMNVGDSEVNLGSLIDMSRMGDGRFDDISFHDDILTLDATGRSPHLWIDFVEINGLELTIETEVRLLTPMICGNVKMVYLTQRGQETNIEINNATVPGEFKACLKKWRDGPLVESKEISIQPIDDQEWTRIKFVAARESFFLFIDGRLISATPREEQFEGFVCLSCRNWRCEMRHPSAMLHRSNSKMAPPERN